MYINNKPIGKITSSVYSPRLKKNIGLALINRNKKNQIENYQLKVNNNFIPVKICKLPFLRNK